MKKLIFIFLLVLPFIINAQTNYYVSPYTGNNADSGLDTANAWATWQKAFDTAEAGDTVFFLNGVWYLGTNDFVVLNPSGGHGNNGTHDAPIVFMNYPNHVPVLDAIGHTNTTDATAFDVRNATNIKFIGLTVRNEKQQVLNQFKASMQFYQNHNIYLERIVCHDGGGYGIWIIGFDTLYVINCDSYGHYDVNDTDPGNTADGFTLGSGTATPDSAFIYYFYGNRAWNNADDGFELSPACQAVVYNNWAFGNGYANGAGVGFKYGWGNLKLTSKRKTYNNLVVYNKGYGMVEQNLNNATLGPVMEYSNNTIYKSKNGFIISPSAIYDTATGYSKVIYRNNLVYNSTWGAYYDQIYLGAWKYPDYDYAVQHHNTWKIKAAAPYFEYNDTVSWSYDSEDAQFIDLPADSAECVSTLSAPRKSTGYLPDITLFRLTGASTLIGAGYNVGMSATPDIGIDWNYSDATYGSEVEEPPSGDVAPTVYSNTVTPKSVQAITGGNVTSDGGATVTERGVVWGTSANPTTSGNKKSTTGTTGLYSVTITGLKSNTTYHVRSYAINAEGTSYGADVLFTTPKYSPATSGGKVIYSDGKVLIIK